MKKFLTLLSFCLSFLIVPHKVVALEGVQLPVVMYHSVHAVNTGQYILHPKSFEQDIMYLKNHGYSFILPREVIAFQEEEKSLPEKPVMLTLDDGFLNNLTIVLPILRKHNAKAAVAVVGCFVDKSMGEEQKSSVYSYLNWQEIASLERTGLVEIANHTYDMHCNKNGRFGAKKKLGETAEQYKKELLADSQKLQNRLLLEGVEPKCFAYPFGKFSEQSEGILREGGFKMALTCEQRVNTVTRKSNLFYLGRFNRPSGISSENFFAKRNIV